MHFDWEANLKLLKLQQNMRQAVACLYLYLGLIGSISLFSSEMQKKKKRFKIQDSHNLISSEKYISVTIKYTIVSWSN